MRYFLAIEKVTRLKSKASRKQRDDNENGWRRERERWHNNWGQV